MTCSKWQLAAAIGAAIFWTAGGKAVALADSEAEGNLSASNILQRAHEKYASLTSYSDSGRTIAEVNGMKFTTTFTVKLARPAFYLVEWEQSVFPFFTNSGAAWSAGEGDFMKLGSSVSRQADQLGALGGATGVSGCASASIPGTFFAMNWGNQLGLPVFNSKRQPDGKVGDVDCYVFATDPAGPTQTLWIGKQDFLIHQIRTVMGAEAMKAAMAKAQDLQAKRRKLHPEITAQIPGSGQQGNQPASTNATATVTTETHENIVVNQEFTGKDFLPHDAGK